MVLNRFRSAGERVLKPLADRLAPGGADRITWASLPVALAAGAAFAFADSSRPALLLVGSVLVLLNAMLDALDGLVARSTGTASPAGNFLDHVVDRYADLAILAGLSLSAYGDVRLGLLAITGVFLTSYLGTQAEAVGLARDYGGVLGRADRLILLTVVPPVQFILVLAGVSFTWNIVGPLGVAVAITLVGWLLLAFGALGHITAIQRFVRGRRALLEREGRRRTPGQAQKSSARSAETTPTEPTQSPPTP